ncbi:MAG: hypothetical protein IK066_04395 [Kiritimatiellae bacterium]|nr:hypothetical protein [Kiritimatiellia bacterium]
MTEAVDYFDGQRRVEPGDGSDGRDARVDIGADEAALDAVEGASAGGESAWTWRVVPDARLQVQGATSLVPGDWRDEGAEFTATNGVWKMEEKFEGSGARFWRVIWRQ